MHQLRFRWSAHPRRNIILVVAVVVVLVAFIFGATRVFGNDSATSTTRNVAVTSGTLQETVSGSGTIATSSTQDLNFSTSGEVTAVNVSQGQKVKKNQVLAEVDSASLSSQVAQAEASVASAESKLSSDEDAGASNAQISADEASLSAARSDLSVAESNLANASLRSPINGTVATLNLTEGQYVAAGSSSSGSQTGSGTSSNSTSGVPAVGGTTSNTSTTTSTSPQIQVISTGSYIVNLSVDDTQISKLTTGDQATVTLTGSSEKVFGTVSSVGLIATTSSGVSSFPVVIKITGNPTGLYSGSAAQVSIVYHQLNDVTQVPSLAVSADGGKKYVQLVTGDGTEEREVTTGVSAGGQTQIVTGLKAGDQVQVTVPVAVGGAQRSGSGGSGGFPGGGGSGGFQPPPGFQPPAGFTP